ncbi:MAG: aminoacetone oxidase family FAD-binding enzyme [Candidatus Dojkabacteria bacterium]|nr:aminoacetone oxidase family FAD-binding enzyme [Candidatus Dojkabacteria bacterium]MDQ7021539.1 aminoacetone oxidase family FAD-binding enzyme [Candidatus Dojkabacteria bacterium]
MKNTYDVIIIGGGAAGMMAAISAKRHNPTSSVLVVDRTFALGRKILVCGAGRCNITNINLADKIDDSYHGADKKFIHSILDKFGYNEIVNFFNELGVELYVERKTNVGKLFPITDQASTIVEMMLDELSRLGIEIMLVTEVIDLVKKDSFKVSVVNVDKQGNQIKGTEKLLSSTNLIVSAGGRSYPALGSNGSGYDLIKKFGHRIIKPIPAALPLEAKHPLCHFLQGVKLEAEVTSIISGEKIKTRTDDLMFKKYGLSGPSILNISREISVHFNREDRNNAEVSINFFPGKNLEEVRAIIKSRWDKRPTQTLEKSLYGLFPNKVALTILKYLELNHEKIVSLVSTEEFNLLSESLSDLRIEIIGTRGWNEAEFTAGGIDSTEVKEGSLESKLVDNLYFCGEILDVDGDVGGFNLSWSWASGFIAGLLIRY